jgi:hypothetical protein
LNKKSFQKNGNEINGGNVLKELKRKKERIFSTKKEVF